MTSRLCDAIGNLDSFEDLKKHLRQGNDFCKEVATIIHDRVKIEIAYADGLAKIGARAKKATGETLGTLKNAWENFASECDHEADARKTVANDLLEQIVKPFKTFTDTQKEARKQAELAVEKAGKTLTDKRSDEIKAKKSSFSRAKESETLTLQLEYSRGKIANDKELSKLDTKCKKAEENVHKSDKELITKVIQAERARLALDSSLTNSCTELQTMEEERINYTKNMLKIYAEVLLESSPKSIQCYATINTETESIDIVQDIETLVNSKGSKKLPGEQLLFTCYEADLDSSMERKRRKFSLEQKLNQLSEVLNAEKKARAGLAKLSSVYEQTPTFSTAGASDNVSTQIAHANAVIDCLDASLHHMGSSLAKLNGLDAPLHRLNDCIQKSKDKQNLPILTLKVPLNRVIIGIPEDVDYELIGPVQYSKHENDGFESDEFEDIDDTQVALPAASSINAEGPEMCRALYDYAASEEDELTLQAGDEIRVLTKSDSGWWTGELGQKTGLFPANYVEQI